MVSVEEGIKLIKNHDVEFDDDCKILWHPYRGETVEKVVKNLTPNEKEKPLLSIQGHKGGQDNNYKLYMLIVGV